MKELLLIRDIVKLIDQLQKPYVSNDTELDLLDELSGFINSNVLGTAGIRDVEKLWQDTYNSYLTQAKSIILPNLTQYCPLTERTKAAVVENLLMAKHSLTTIISMRFNFLDIIGKVMSGVPHDQAVPPKLAQAIVNINLSPKAFFLEMIPYIIESRAAIQTTVELEDVEMELLLNNCKTEEVAAILLLNVCNMSEDDIRLLLENTRITVEDINAAVMRF